MIQALHIFRKDTRRFAYEICVLAALAYVWALANILNQKTAFHGSYARVAGLILPLGWCYLIARLIHEEPLTGDRQFWITRPYSRGSLLAAKALFVVAFINVPLLLAGFAILGAAGYQPLAYLPNFLWIQLTFTGGVLLLPAALASLTRTLVQVVLTILGLCICFITIDAMAGAVNSVSRFQSNGLFWATGMVLPRLVASAGLCILLLQFRWRLRLISAGVGIVVAVLIVSTNSSLSRRIGTSVQSRLFGQNGAGLVAASVAAAGIERDSKLPVHAGIAVAIPLRVRNVPEGETAAPEIIELIFEAPGGRRWSSGWIAVGSSEESVFQADPSSDGTFAWKQSVVMDRGFWESARSHGVTIRGTVWTMLYGRRSLRLSENRVTPVPGDGVCSVSHPFSSGWFVKCHAPFHEPFNSIESDRLISVWSSPFPAEFGMSPLATDVARAGEAGPIFVRFDPRAYIQRSVEPASVQLK